MLRFQEPGSRAGEGGLSEAMIRKAYGQCLEYPVGEDPLGLDCMKSGMD